MTELIGICAGAHPVHRHDNLKSSEELRSCQKQMARACLARRKLTQLGVAPQGEERYQSAWCSRPLGEPMCIIPTVLRFASKRGGSVVGVCGGHAPSGSQCPSPLLIPAKAIPNRGNRRRSQQYGDAWAVSRSEAHIQRKSCSAMR